MERMPNAPLRYTLMVARFPKIINMANHVGSFQDAIRADYPLTDEHINHGVMASVGPEGVNFEMVSEQLWQFADIERSHAFILSSEFLVLHAGIEYRSHTDFIERFQAAVRVLRDVPELNVQHVQGLGYRYVDLVVPRADRGERLSQYLAPWALPTETPDLGPDGLLFGESAHVMAFRTEAGALRLQALRAPPTTMPLDLDSPLVRKNGWVPERPEGDFAVLDIDHSGIFASPRQLDPDVLGRAFATLRASARLLFDRATTKYAMEVWGRKS